MATLLGKNNQHLEQIINKGIKGDFELISKWIQNIYIYTKHILSIIDESEVPILLNILKLGLTSKNEEVVLWSSRSIARLGNEFSQSDLMQVIFII